MEFTNSEACSLAMLILIELELHQVTTIFSNRIILVNGKLKCVGCYNVRGLSGAVSNGSSQPK